MKLKNRLPEEFSLGNNYPNPFNPETTIPVHLPERSAVSLKVYNILGQCVRIMVDNKILDAGKYNITFNGKDKFGRNLPSGIYFYKIETDKFKNISKKMVLIK
jgi:flagellar hook assembly protein FlgD